MAKGIDGLVRVTGASYEGGPNSVEEGSGFVIGDGLVITAGHVVYDYNHAHDSTPQQVSLADISASSGQISNNVVWDERNYRDAYRAEVINRYNQTISKGTPSPGNDRIEARIYANDVVVISGAGKVSRDDPGLVLFLDSGDLISNNLQNVLLDASISRYGLKTTNVNSIQITSASAGVIKNNPPAVQGDSGGPYILEFAQHKFVIGVQSSIVGPKGQPPTDSYGTYFFESEWQSITALAVQGKKGNLSAKEPTNLLVGTVAGGNLSGSLRPDIILGRDGKDELSGGDEHAKNPSAWANDQLFGGKEDDVFVPGFGNDLFHGGSRLPVASPDLSLDSDGNDSISYAGLPADGKKGIRIDVAAAPKDMTFKDTPDIAHAVYVTDLARNKDTDTLISIEKITGSGANDILAISTFDAARIATYNSSDDTHSSGLFEVDLGGQAERGADLIDFSGLTAGVGVHFDDARPRVSLLSDDAHRLYVAGAEQVLGGSGDDEFYGGNANEVFAGGNGNDLIYGGGGRDFIFGGAGMDRLYGDGGNDKIVVGNNGHIDGTGGTFVDGGAGNDTIFILRAAERPSSDSAATTTLVNAATITLANGDAGDRIVWNGHELSGGTFKVIVNPNADGDGVGLIIPIADYVGALGEIYSWRPGQQTLTINLPDMTMLSIAFDNGDYGLTFAAPPANEFAPSVPRSAAASLPNTATTFERFDAIEGRHAAFDSVGETNAPRAPEPGQAGAQPADSSAPAAAFMLASDEAALFSLLATDYFAPAHALTDITSLAA